MATLAGSTIASTYTYLLKMDGTSGVTGSLVKVEDGDATDTALSVSTTAIAVDATDKIYLDAGGDTYIFESAADIMDFYAGGAHMLSLDETNDESVFNEGGADIDFRIESTGNTHAFHLDAGSNVININRPISSNTASTPDEVLALKAFYPASGTTGNAGAGSLLSFYIPDDETNPIKGAGIAGVRESADDSNAQTSLVFYTSQDDATLDEWMRITSGGSLGLGAGTGTSKIVHIDDNGSTTPAIRLQNSSGNYWDYAFGSSNALNIGYNGSTKLVVDTAGQLGFNATPADAVIHLNNDITGSNSIYIDHDSDGNGIYIENNNASSGGGWGVFSSYGVTTDNNKGALYGYVTSQKGYAGYFLNSESGNDAVSYNHVVGISANASAFRHWTLHVSNSGTDSSTSSSPWVDIGGAWIESASVSTATSGTTVSVGKNGSYVGACFQANLTMNSNGGGFLFRGHSDSDDNGDGIDREFYVSAGGVVAGESSFSTGADYAEYFETKDGKSIAVGTTVKLDGEKVVPCEDGDTPIGVIRPKDGASSSIGNTAHSKWNKKYLRDDYGGYLSEECTITEWVERKLDKESDGEYKQETVWYYSDKIPNDVTVPDNAVVKIHHSVTGKKITRKILNPDFDKKKDYVTREDRDEWVVVGLLGQVPVTKGQPLASNWIKMEDISDTVEMYFVK